VGYRLISARIPHAATLAFQPVFKNNLVAEMLLIKSVIDINSIEVQGIQ
jgi:hypothetical protein